MLLSPVGWAFKWRVVKKTRSENLHCHWATSDKLLGDSISLILQQAVKQYLDREEVGNRCPVIELSASFYPLPVPG